MCRPRNNDKHNASTRPHRTRTQDYHSRASEHKYFLSLMTFSSGLQVINRTATAAIHNSLSSFPGVTAKPALGPTFTFLAHATIWLNTASAALGRGHTERPRPEGGQTHIVEVFRSRVGVRRLVLLQFHTTDATTALSPVGYILHSRRRRCGKPR